MNLKEDLKKLRAYARSLGVSVRTNPRLKEHGQFTYDLEKPLIELEKADDTSTILTMLHELGHALHWISQGKRLSPEDDRIVSMDKETMSEAERKALFEFENKAISQMHGIWKLLSLSIPEYKVLAQQRLDRWTYMQFRYFGEYPCATAIPKHRARFRKKVKEEIQKDARRNKYQTREL